MKRSILLCTLLLALPAIADEEDDALRAEALRLFGSLKAPPAASLAGAEMKLGRALFWDMRASLDGKTACASCHPADAWGADHRRASVDARGEHTSRQSQTVFNAMAQPGLRWLADRKTGADQAEGSMTGSMGFASKQAGMEKLRELGYEGAFKAAYPQEAAAFSARNYGRAIAAYEASLVTPAPFDRFLGGEDRAITERQKAGLRTFMAAGCAGCHDGALLGGTQLRKFGLAHDYWTATGSPKRDAGRYAVTKKEDDRYVFRVPMLRNVARTAPYFHDGSVDTLDRAVAVMGEVQLGKTLDERTVSLIAAFLESLTGEVPAHSAPVP